MRSTRSPWFAAVALAALAGGCNSETTPATDSPASSTPTPASTTPTPVTTPADKAADAKAGMGADMTPKAADAPKADPAPELKLEAPEVKPPSKDDKAKDAGGAAAVVPAKDDGKLTDDEVAAIKTLPADEQAAALKQVLCPVSGEHLGSMDAPIKVSAEGKTFYLCCKSCKKEVEKNPKEVVAKLAGK